MTCSSLIDPAGEHHPTGRESGREWRVALESGSSRRSGGEDIGEATGEKLDAFEMKRESGEAEGQRTDSRLLHSHDRLMTDTLVVPDYMSRRGLAVDVVLLSSGII